MYFIVGDDTPAREVDASDEIRGELERSLDDLDYERWLTTSFTADRAFALDPPPAAGLSADRFIAGPRRRSW